MDELRLQRRPLFYILDGHAPVPITDPFDFRRADMFSDIDARRVAYTDVPGGYVSTVFLSIDHNYRSIGPPILFETMVFGCGAWDEYQERYATWEDAEAGHATLLDIIATDPNREGII